MSAYHQHGPGSDTEPPASGCLGILWALGLTGVGLTALVILWRLARRVWGA